MPRLASPPLPSRPWPSSKQPGSRVDVTVIVLLATLPSMEGPSPVLGPSWLVGESRSKGSCCDSSRQFRTFPYCSNALSGGAWIV